MDRYVHFGCGLSAPAGWRNFDISPSLRLQRLPLVGAAFRRAPFPAWPDSVEYGDIVRGLPIPPASCDGVYCSHVLEHLSLTDLRTALDNVRALLRPGGRFRLVVPDLAAMTRAYLADDSPRAAYRFMEDTVLGTRERPRGPSGLLRSWLGNARHLWMWDEASMRAELERAGFGATRRAECGDSGDPAFDAVEDPGRWVEMLGVGEERRPMPALGMEARA